MLDPKLQALISELFVTDFASKSVFAGEILESLEIDNAIDAQQQGLPIPESSYTDFETISYKLMPGHQEINSFRIHDFEVYLAATFARLINTRGFFFLALWQENSAGGPFIHVQCTSDRIEISLLANYRMLEKRQNWFAGALSLFEWYSADSETLGIKMFRKAWSTDTDRIEIATAVSLAVSHVLDPYAGGGVVIQLPQLEDEVLSEQTTNGQLWPVVDDASVGWEIVREMDNKGFHPPLCTNPPALEAQTAVTNIKQALDIATKNDDEFSIYALGELLDSVSRREVLFKLIPDKLRLFVELSKDISSRRILPENHPDYEYPEEEDEDWDEELDNLSPERSQAGHPISHPTQPQEFQNDDSESDSPDLDPETISRLWELQTAFEGLDLITPKTTENDELLLANLLGAYLRKIPRFSGLHEPKLFGPIFEERVRNVSHIPHFPEISQSDYQPTVLNRKGISPGVVERLKARAANVFGALLQLQSIEDFEEISTCINSFSDELLMDCTIWSFIITNPDKEYFQTRLIEKTVNEIAKYPRI